MINGTVDIANASRMMKDKEMDMARENGIEPIEWVVGWDALAFSLHKDSPIDAMSLDQLANICGEEGGDCVAPSVATAIDRTYPIARPPFMYTAGQREGAIMGYMDWIQSDDGQCILQLFELGRNSHGVMA